MLGAQQQPSCHVVPSDIQHQLAGLWRVSASSSGSLYLHRRLSPGRWVAGIPALVARRTLGRAGARSEGSAKARPVWISTVGLKNSFLTIPKGWNIEIG